MTMTSPLRTAFDAFMAAEEASSTILAWRDMVLALLAVMPDETRTDPEELWGLERFDALMAHCVPGLPFRQKRVFEQLSEEVRKRKALLLERKENRGLELSNKERRTRVLVSGGGPCGLRSAVENVLLGFHVTLVEKRSTFSRVNILLLWHQTAEDLLSLGAKCFYPEWRLGVTTHMGTREIQLTLLKSALLLGVNVHYKASVVGLFSTSSGWNAVIAHEEGKRISESNRESLFKRASRRISGVLNLNKPKHSDYNVTFHGKGYETSEVDTKFIQAAQLIEKKNHVPVPFDSLIVAEGEWSETLRSLGFVKSVDKFAQAIGMVINMEYDKTNPEERNAREFTLTKLNGSWKTGLLQELEDAGLKCEVIEYLRGTTHYFVATVTAESLLTFGIVKEMRVGEDLLSQDNLNMDKLFEAARVLVTKSGLPESTQFHSDNPVQIFDFSSRARARHSVKALVAAGASSPPVVLDTEEVVAGGQAVIPAGAIAAVVMPVGDALLEPFWPQGLGVNRGFHGTIDAAFATLCMDQERGLSSLETSAGDSSATRNGVTACMVEREFAYSAMNVVTWKPGQILMPFHQWASDPLQRYQGNLIETVRTVALKSSQPVPPRIAALPCLGLSLVGQGYKVSKPAQSAKPVSKPRDSQFRGVGSFTEKQGLPRVRADTASIIAAATRHIPRFRSNTATVAPPANNTPRFRSNTATIIATALASDDSQ